MQKKITGGGERQKKKTFCFDFQAFEAKTFCEFLGAEIEMSNVLYGKRPQKTYPKAPTSLWDKDQKNGEVKHLKA